MAKKKTGNRGLWIVGFFIISSLIQNIPGLGESGGFIISLGLVVSIFVIVHLNKQKENKGGFVQNLADQLEKTAMDNAQKFINEHPDDPTVDTLEAQIENYKDVQGDKKRKRLANQLHSVGGEVTDGPSEKVKDILQKNYYQPEYITKDALTKTTRNPYSLDGK